MRSLNEPHKKFFIAILFCFAFLSILFSGLYFYSVSKNARTITVNGTSQVQVSNQISTYTVSVDFQNSDKQKAVDAATVAANSIVKALKDFGIPAKDVQTQNLNVYQNQDPYYEGGTTVYKPGNWHANYSINVTLRDLTKSEALTNLIVSFDNATMFGPNLTVDQTQVDEASILSDAVADARAKAEKIATSSGYRLGAILSISEGTNYAGIPIVYSGMGGGAGGGLPVESGSTTVSKTVTVTFKLR